MKRLRDSHTYAGVENIQKYWLSGGVEAVKKFLNDENTVVYEDTWADKIKNLLNENKFRSVHYEIELVVTNINFLKNGKEKEGNKSS